MARDRWVNAAIVIASGEIGTRETSRNRSAEIDAWAAALGLPPGLPWCLIWIQHVFARAAITSGYLGHQLPRTGRVERFRELCVRRRPGWFDDAIPASPPPGTIALHLRDVTSGDGHCGIVLSSTPTEIETIEGNTNDAGSREGDRVAIKRRPRSYWNAGAVVVARDPKAPE